MNIEQLDYQTIDQLSTKDKAYLREDAALRKFYTHSTDFQSFNAVIEQRQSAPVDRKMLVEVLKAQYSAFKGIHPELNLIEKLGDNRTFTVVTAHQPSLFTGPLYFVYKIISAINLAEALAVKHPEFNFVPVFVVGGEDHDFDEINHTSLFGKPLVWETESGGPVGQLSTESLAPVLEQLESILGDGDHADFLRKTVVDPHRHHATYGVAVQEMVVQLFHEYGLVALRMDDQRFKQAFAKIIETEIFEQPSKALIETASTELEAAGYSGQAYAREINFFYLENGKRLRLEQSGDQFQVVDGTSVFSKSELQNLIKTHPERFSPNVIMRPLFQEFILPNLAYVGGGGEIAYWLERKKQFAHFGLPMPMLVRRNSVLWIDKSNSKKMEKLNLSIEDLFSDTHQLIKDFVKAEADESLELTAEKEQLTALFDSIARRTDKIDSTLVKTVLAEKAKQVKAIEGLEARLLKAEKQRHEVALKQIEQLKEKLFPGNGLQERSDNFMQFFLKHGPAYFDVLKAHLHPLDKKFVVIQEGT